MKKLLTLMLLFMSLVTFSQTELSQDEFKKLPIDVQNKINSVKKDSETNTQIETVGKWIGLGKEVGYAFDGALTAITTTATKFSETKLGKLTMYLVIYKVIGRDIIRLVFGILWIILVFTVSIYIHLSYARDKKILKSEKYNIDSKKYDREWYIQDGNIDFAIASAFILVIGIIASVPMFLSK